jgi:NOL1/NOP2/sun family putative RNA methylase
MRLPEEFIGKMKELLDENEYVEFINSYEKPRYYGLRVNTLKISVDEFLKISPFKLEKIPWVKDGFYYSEDDNPGKHPYYHAGLYYIQEPSAMLPGGAINVRPGDRVLDLCAAPGGKTVQMAAAMEGKGILVANDINYERVKALVKNIELCGVRNAIVTNETPENLAQCFPEYFDKILVDAPCSGEGMFRKDPDAVKSWGKYKCEKCAGTQISIMRQADKMLKPGGYLLYSTCTFSPEENEQIINDFLLSHYSYKLVEIPKVAKMEGGRPQWAGGNHEFTKTARMWPHRIKGEGHFAALLKKGDLEQHSEQNLEKHLGCHLGQRLEQHYIFSKTINKKSGEKIDSEMAIAAYMEFERENLNIQLNKSFIKKNSALTVVGKNIYLTVNDAPSLEGIKVSKFGWYLGSLERGKFIPSHSFVMSLKKEDIKNVIDMGNTSSDITRYLKGETIIIEGINGYEAKDHETKGCAANSNAANSNAANSNAANSNAANSNAANSNAANSNAANSYVAICVDGYTIGWAKQMDGMLKNLYPKGWRKLS